MPRLRITDTDVELRTLPGETILAGLHRSGYAGNTGCRRGGCGICKVELVSGRVEYPETVADEVLSAEERARGVCLICRAVPTEDVDIALPSDFRLRCVAPFLAAMARR